MDVGPTGSAPGAVRLVHSVSTSRPQPLHVVRGDLHNTAHIPNMWW
jgi:hypothetical protein